MQGESMRVVRFDRRRPNLRLKLTAPSLKGIRMFVYVRTSRRSLGAPR